jgi:hypothetical protein
MKELLFLIALFVFIDNFLNQFSAIEIVFYYLGWWFIVGCIVWAIFCMFIKSSKDK